MHIYLSLKQMLLIQLSYLLSKRNNTAEDQDRLAKRLEYLKIALEQMKSYNHNNNYQHVLRHFKVEPNAKEELTIRQLNSKFGNIESNKMGSHHQSGTYFDGAEMDTYHSHFIQEEQKSSNTNSNTNSNSKPSGYGSTRTTSINDKKRVDKQRGVRVAASEWIHFRGFVKWIKKQSFIKIAYKHNEKKLRKLWQSLIAIPIINGWKTGSITSQNIVRTHHNKKSHCRPYVNIIKCGTKEIVKASLFRLSLTTNRIFRFELSAPNVHSNQARRSIDMDNEELPQPVTATQMLRGRSLFNKIKNKDVLRVACTVLWDSALAGNVLEEFLQAPRFSMFGIHASKMAAQLMKEMEASASAVQRNPNGFVLPSPSRPPTQIASKKYTYQQVQQEDEEYQRAEDENENVSDYEDDYEELNPRDDQNKEVSDHQMYYQQRNYAQQQFEPIVEESAEHQQEEPRKRLSNQNSTNSHTQHASVIRHEKFADDVSDITSQIQESGIYDDVAQQVNNDNGSDQDEYRYLQNH